LSGTLNAKGTCASGPGGEERHRSAVRSEVAHCLFDMEEGTEKEGTSPASRKGALQMSPWGKKPLQADCSPIGGKGKKRGRAVRTALDEAELRSCEKENILLIRERKREGPL